ncbi:MAG TPA: ABC transporter substrate-binding protein [Thermomicrobiales bacterium]|nr:ABC transporter substrate-binding protein [Thermomicrobiales bacterium]
MTEPRLPRVLTRRRFLSLTGLAAAGVVLTACGGTSATPTAATSTSSSAASTASSTTATAASTTAATTSAASAATSSATTSAATSSRASGATPAASGSPTTSSSSSSSAANIPTKFQEAPTLAEQVKAGKLPPVEQRLPKAPMVIQPIKSVGSYGGTWRTVYTGAADSAWFSRTVGYESLVRWDVDWKNLISDIATKYEVSSDGKEFTWHLRPGMKWSDGQPFGADDFVFWYEDVILNDQLTPVKPTWFMTAGKLGKVVKVDDSTVKMVFEQPNGLLLKKLAMLGMGTFIKPAHYAKKFHTKYNKAEVDKMVSDQHLADWAALFNKMVGTTPNVGDARWFNPELPTIFPWMVTSGIGQGNQVAVVRNPYFWKVDPQGNQLPYIDGITYLLVEAGDVSLLKALNGEIDMDDRHFTSSTNKPVLTDNQQKGQYHFFTETPDSMNRFCVMFNFNHKDPVMKQIIQNVEFRIGLSYAIDRKSIIDTVYVGQGEPWQSAPLKQSPYYHERLATQYLEYDLDKAKQHLDKVLPQKGGDGMRLRPDGKPLQIAFEVNSTATDLIDVLKLVQKTWASVGVPFTIKSEDRALRTTRVTAADYDVVCDGGPGGIDAILGPYWYFPFADFNGFATQWALWWESGGTKGEEPTEPAKKQQQIYDQITVTPDPDKQKELMKQLLDITADQFWVIGACTVSEGYGLVKNNFFNVADHMFSSGQEYVNPGASMPEQFYMTK